jgi:hypothetical protein
MKKNLFLVVCSLLVACSSGGGSNNLGGHTPESPLIPTVPLAPTTPAATAAAQSALKAAASAAAAEASATVAASAAANAGSAAKAAQTVSPSDPATTAVVSAANAADASAQQAAAASSAAKTQAQNASIAAQTALQVQDQANLQDQAAAQAQAAAADQAAKDAAAQAAAADQAAKDAAAAAAAAMQLLPVTAAAALSSDAAVASAAAAATSATAAGVAAIDARAAATAAQAISPTAPETLAAVDAALAAETASAKAAAAKVAAQNQAAIAQAAAQAALTAPTLADAQAQAAIAEQAAKEAAAQALIAEQAAQEAKLAKDTATQALAQLTGVAPVSNCNENFIPKTGLVPATAGALGTDTKDPVVAKKLLDDMVVKYEDFIERNECDNWFYFPDDPRNMTAADKAKFLDPTVWPVEFEFSDDFPPETLEAFRRNLNMIRYIIHTKAYAHILKDYILMDRGQIVDYREALLAIRTMKAKITIKPSSNFYDGNWYAVVRGSVVNGVRVPLAANLPSNFDPTFGLTNASIEASRSMIGPPSVGFRRKDATVLDKDITVLGFGADAMGPNRAWYNKGFHIWIFQLLPHEILHVVGYTHSGLDATNTSLWTDVTKDGRVIKDVNYALGPAIDKLAGYYYKSWWTNTTMRNYTFVPSFPIFDVPTFYSTKTPVDSFGNPKAWYLTTEDLIFPMNYYGAPYITKASAISDGLVRNLNDVAYDVNNIKGDTWKLYPKESKYINWDCNFKDSSGNPLDCQGTPNSSGYSSSRYRTFPITALGNPAYVRTTAMWTMSTPKNAGPGRVN